MSAAADKTHKATARWERRHNKDTKCILIVPIDIVYRGSTEEEKFYKVSTKFATG